MKKIFFVFLALVMFSNFADARFARVGGFRSYSRPSISRSYSRPTTRPATTSAPKPAVKATTKTTTKAKTAESSTKKAAQNKKQVAEQPQKEIEKTTSATSTGTVVQSSSGSVLPWFFAGYMINRNSNNGNISCDCSPLQDKPELYQQCLQQCPKKQENEK